MGEQVGQGVLHLVRKPGRPPQHPGHVAHRRETELAERDPLELLVRRMLVHGLLVTAIPTPVRERRGVAVRLVGQVVEPGADVLPQPDQHRLHVLAQVLLEVEVEQGRHRRVVPIAIDPVAVRNRPGVRGTLGSDALRRDGLRLGGLRLGGHPASSCLLGSVPLRRADLTLGTVSDKHQYMYPMNR